MRHPAIHIQLTSRKCHDDICIRPGTHDLVVDGRITGTFCESHAVDRRIEIIESCRMMSRLLDQANDPQDPKPCDAVPQAVIR